LREGIKLAKRLRFYPNVPDLKIERCGDGLKLEVEHPSIGQQVARDLLDLREEQNHLYR
jgi:hypothetical protein